MEMPALRDPACMLLPLGIILNSDHKTRGCFKSELSPYICVTQMHHTDKLRLRVCVYNHG